MFSCIDDDTAFSAADALEWERSDESWRDAANRGMLPAHFCKVGDAVFPSNCPGKKSTCSQDQFKLDIIGCIML
jgi:hypothetical protein